MVNYNRIKAERIATGKRSEDVANALNISKRAYSNKENGKNDFTTSEFEKWLEFLKIPKEQMHIFFTDSVLDVERERGE